MPFSHTIGPAVSGCVEACRRCEHVLTRVPDEFYSIEGISGGAIGTHLRHCLDHFRCLLRGLSSGIVDYDARDRDAELEQNREKIGSALREVATALQALPEAAIDQPIRVRQTAAPNTEPIVFTSTIERELVFVSGHTIHHLALIEQLARPAGIDLAGDLSLAFSTAAYRARAG